tara:strand:+ start:2126 stop:2677 length:552 start_codon:yes stop_codon:yes gene_type:complete
MPIDNTNLIWLDLELTGLNFDTGTIVEIATIATDKDLNILAEGPDLVIHHDEEIIKCMDEWCHINFETTGLTEEIRNSKISLSCAEEKTLEFVRKFTEPEKSPLCGNSIHNDRRILYRVMPELDNHFHYRNVDVSTIKELSRRWKPEMLKEVEKLKKYRHRAKDDIVESIAELKYYRENFFKV